MKPSILVVGGGIAGHAMCRALALHGLECTLVEQRDAHPGSGMGLNLPGNAMRAVGALGIVDALSPHGLPLARREYRNSSGRLLFAVDEEKFWRGIGTPTCVRHGQLLRALQLPDTDPWGKRVLTARPVRQQVEVLLEGELRAKRYDFVVGADGVHSVLRSAVSSERVRPSAMTRSSWRMISDNPGIESWTAWSGATETFLLMPVEKGLVYGYAASTRGGSTGGDPTWLGEAFAGFPIPVRRVVSRALAGAGTLHHAAVDEVRLERWYRGRLVLIGDAAHATGPIWAQGAAMAMEDALVLADILARRSNWDHAGAEFEQQRRPRVDHVQAATDRMSRLAALPGWFRDLAAPVLGPRAYRSAYATLRDDPLIRHGHHGIHKAPRPGGPDEGQEVRPQGLEPRTR